MEKIQGLVVVDCQNDFIDGSLANKVAQAKIQNVVNKINNFKGEYIFVTRDTHYADYLNTPEGKALPVVHCIEGTKGWELNAEVEQALIAQRVAGKTVTIIDKPTFGSLDLMGAILELEANTTEPIPMELEFIGFCTDICVASNAIMAKAYTYDFADITVDASCCASVYLSEEDEAMRQKAALQTMRACQINIINE